MLFALALAACTTGAALEDVGTKPDGDADTVPDTDVGTVPDTDVDTDVTPPDTGPHPPALETYAQATARNAALFDPTILHVVTVDLAPADYDLLLADGSDWLPATVTIDGEAIPTAGVRLAGDQQGFGWDGKVDLRLDFDEVWDGMTYGGLERIAFDDQASDPAASREVIAARVLAAAGVPAPRAAFATVQVQGGVPALYTLREEVDEDFLQRWFPPGLGALWEAEDGADFTAAGLGAWAGDGDPAILEAVRVAVQTPSPDWEAQVDAVIQLDQLRKLWAWQAVIGNDDGWPYDLDDVWAYADPLQADRLAFVPERVDEAFDPATIWDGVEPEVAVRCRFDPACDAAIRAEILAAADAYDALGAETWAQEAFDLTDAAMKADTERGTPAGQVRTARDALMLEVAGRGAVVRAQVEASP